MSTALHASAVVAVIGSGAMGAGIAQIAATAGHTVLVYDARPEAAAQAIDGIRKTYGRLVEKGKMSGADADASAARLRVADALEDVAGAALVVEAISEQLEAKRGLFKALEAIVAEDCILATNTSSISVTAIGAALARPQRLVGMHFFNPVPLMALVEVISGLATDRAVAEMVFATGRAWGKHPVHAASTPGFIVNRVARPYYAEGLRVATEQGASPATLDAVMREAGGFRMGPFELMDLIGHDVNFAVTSSVFAAYFNDPRFTPSILQQELVNAGFLGRKTGRGFFQYGEQATPAIAATEAPRPSPHHASLHGDDAQLSAIATRAAQAGIEIRPAPTAADAPVIVVGGARIYLTDGRSASQRAAETGHANTLLIDLLGDAPTAKRIALTRAAHCSDDAGNAAIGLLQAAGYAVSPLADVPGMIVMRTVAMLANEAADAVNQGVCNAQAVDTAMEKGVNYPRGPLRWADAIGLPTLQTVLRNLADTYGEDRYRVSPLIQQKVAARQNFHA